MNQPPFHLRDITLSQWVSYHDKYGRDADLRFDEIKKMEDSKQKRDAFLLHQFDAFCRQYSFFTGTPLESIMRMDIAEVMPLIKLQGESKVALKQEEALLDYNATFEWGGEQWAIQPIFPAAEKLNRQQFTASQDIALIFADLQEGRQEALYALCAAYLRHLGEPYDETLALSRTDLMKQLPLSISLCVKKYVEDSIRNLVTQQPE